MDQATEQSEELNTTSGAAAIEKLLFGAEEIEATQETKAEEAEEETTDQPDPEAKNPEDLQEQQPTYTIVVDGKEQTVTLDELRNGYQRQQDYTRKTQELSEQRRQAEAHLQKLEEEQTRYAQAVNQLTSQLQQQVAEDQKVDWPSLLESDPIEYLKQKQKAEERQVALYQAQRQQQAALHQQQEKQAEAYQTYLESQRSELLNKLPEWKDSAKAESERNELRQFMAKQGYSDQEINSIVDHRQVLMIRNAMQYEKLMAGKQDAVKRVQNIPTKAERPGGAQDNDGSRNKAAMNRFHKAPNLRNAAAAIESLLK